MTSTSRTTPRPESPTATPSLTTRLGRVLSWATAGVGVVAAITAMTTPPRSGPFCTGGCVGYPYTDVATYAPRDYWWMYPQSLWVLLVLALLVCVRHAASRSARAAGGVAVALATVGAAAILIDYAVQLAVVQPSLWRGETATLSLFSQYNPHGVFIALEDVGYLLLGAAALTAAAVFTGPTRPARSLHWLMIGGGTLTVVALPALVGIYRADLEYRYEVAAIALVWITFIAAAAMLPRWFHRMDLDAGQGAPLVNAVE